MKRINIGCFVGDLMIVYTFVSDRILLMKKDKYRLFCRGFNDCLYICVLNFESYTVCSFVFGWWGIEYPWMFFEFFLNPFF